MTVPRVPQVGRILLNDEPTNRVVNQIITSLSGLRDYVGDVNNFQIASQETAWEDLTLESDFLQPDTIGWGTQVPQWRLNYRGQVELRGIVVAANTYAATTQVSLALIPVTREINYAFIASVPEVTLGVSAVALAVSGPSLVILPFTNANEGYSLDGIVYDLTE